MNMNEIKRRLGGANLRDTDTVKEILAARKEKSTRELLENAYLHSLIRATPAGEWEYHDPFAEMDMEEIRRKLGHASFRDVDMTDEISEEATVEAAKGLLRKAFLWLLIRVMTAGEWEYQPPTSHGPPPPGQLLSPLSSSARNDESPLPEPPPHSSDPPDDG